ncbi:hypothetical protein ACJ41O_001654 [Fusarium nematophilum]
MGNTARRLSAASTVAIYPVRLVQIGSIVATGYSVGYLIFMHQNHYCAWYGCGGSDLNQAAVPIGEVLFISACVLATLEWILFSSNIAFRAHTGKPALVSTQTQFALACFVLLVYSIGFVSFTSIQSVRSSWPICWNMWSNSVYDSPEKYFCIMTQNGVTCGLISWLAIMVVALLNLVEYRKDSGVGGIHLGDDTRLPDEADDLSIRDLAANGS